MTADNFVADCSRSSGTLNAADEGIFGRGRWCCFILAQFAGRRAGEHSQSAKVDASINALDLRDEAALIRGLDLA